MKNLAIVLLLIVTVTLACKKYDAEYTYAKPTIAATWAKNEQFYTPTATVFIDSLNLWRTYTVFSFTYENDPDKLGFANPYNAGKGTNALYMRNFYSSQNLTADSPYYNVTIPKCFQLIPTKPDNTEGTVKVIPQTVRLYRRDRSFFDIILVGGEGVYNTKSQLLEVEVIFNETSIGGPADRRRKYRFLP
ncbi:MAG TPA: hypothetical protein DCL43_09525 [Chitinophagaceae bacterium]|nr:hypothetical protein [Chitinophagaceae bacterium]HAN39158.1 hypothetical protein [Chitinophagaceae bacterium]